MEQTPQIARLRIAKYEPADTLGMPNSMPLRDFITF
jgi:hypothetical protein